MNKFISEEEIRKNRLKYAKALIPTDRNDPPWGDPMTAEEYVRAMEAWGESLTRDFGYVSAQNDEMVSDPQCGGCRLYMPIEGASGSDWGACGNTLSNRIGRIVFEHHACPQHSEIE